MCLLIFCMKCCKAWTRSIHSWAYAHKHALCSSVTKSLRDAASVCIASDALEQSKQQNMPAAGSVS